MKDKLLAASFHLLVSCAFFAIVYFLIFHVWYPAPLAKASGVGSVFFLLVLVDLIVGPLLTAVVYKKNKRTLRIDLAIIIALQLTAFAFGGWSIAMARPVWIVFGGDRFDLVSANDIDWRNEDRVRNELKTGLWGSPRWIAARNPINQEELNNLIFESLSGGADLPQRIDLFVPLDIEWGSVVSKSLPVSELINFNSPEKVSFLLEDWPTAIGWLPLMARSQPMVVLIGQDKPLAVVDLEPWK